MSGGLKRPCALFVRQTEDERAVLIEKAARAGLSITEFVTRAIIAYDEVSLAERVRVLEDRVAELEKQS